MKGNTAVKILLMPTLLFLVYGFSSAAGNLSGISLVYGVASVVSYIMMLGYYFAISSKNKWFSLLFTAVAIVNTGYFFLSISKTLGWALMANRLAYLGSTFLPFFMLMNILNLGRITYSRLLPKVLTVIAFVMFAITASPGILPLYYKEVTLEIVNNTAVLNKVYGPWHILYSVYLLAYFSAMVWAVFYVPAKKLMASSSHCITLAIAVFVNLSVWYIEQHVSFGFEFLSITYIISELFLLGLYLVVNENNKQMRQAQNAAVSAQTAESREDVKKGQYLLQALQTLTPTERAVFNAYIDGATTKQVLEDFNIKENTLKYHNRNLYSKLGVSSRREMIRLYRLATADKLENK